MKKINTAVVALALGMSECDIRERYDGAKEIEFSEGIKLRENAKIKRYEKEAEEYSKQLEAVMKIMNG